MCGYSVLQIKRVSCLGDRIVHLSCILREHVLSWGENQSKASFWVVTPYRLLRGYERFGVTHHIPTSTLKVGPYVPPKLQDYLQEYTASQPRSLHTVHNEKIFRFRKYLFIHQTDLGFMAWPGQRNTALLRLGHISFRAIVASLQMNDLSSAYSETHLLLLGLLATLIGIRCSFVSSE